MEQLSTEEDLKKISEPLYWMDIKENNNYKTQTPASVIKKFTSVTRSPLEKRKEDLSLTYSSHLRNPVQIIDLSESKKKEETH